MAYHQRDAPDNYPQTIMHPRLNGQTESDHDTCSPKYKCLTKRQCRYGSTAKKTD